MYRLATERTEKTFDLRMEWHRAGERGSVGWIIIAEDCSRRGCGIVEATDL